MVSIAHLKKEAMFFKTISSILAEIENANISLITCTEVKLSNDSSHLTVFVTFSSKSIKSLENLNKIKGFIKKRLSQSIKTRRIPSVIFELDKTFEKAKKIEEILKNINKRD